MKQGVLRRQLPVPKNLVENRWHGQAGDSGKVLTTVVYNTNEVVRFENPVNVF